MPDDRLFHKRLGHSERVGRLTDFEYIVWQAYILSADDFGVLRFTAVSLQADHDRLASKPLRVVQKALACVCGSGLLYTFEHQGQVYGYQRDWQDWQHVDYPRLTINPRPADALVLECSDDTRKLFARHPGGWRKKSQEPPEGAPKDSTHLRDTFGTPSDEITRKPLAVSRKPVASSRQPLAAVPASADARSKHPVYTSDRFAVFEWQFDELSKVLGSHLDAFDLLAFFDALSQQSRADGLVIPKSEVWAWLQVQVLDEAKRRGLPMASAVPVRDKAAENRAQDERILAEIQEERRLRAGR